MRMAIQIKGIDHIVMFWGAQGTLNGQILG